MFNITFLAKKVLEAMLNCDQSINDKVLQNLWYVEYYFVGQKTLKAMLNCGKSMDYQS